MNGIAWVGWRDDGIYLLPRRHRTHPQSVGPQSIPVSLQVLYDQFDGLKLIASKGTDKVRVHACRVNQKVCTCSRRPGHGKDVRKQRRWKWTPERRRGCNTLCCCHAICCRHRQPEGTRKNRAAARGEDDKKNDGKTKLPTPRNTGNTRKCYAVLKVILQRCNQVMNVFCQHFLKALT